MSTIIMTDSTCDLTREYIDAHDCLEVLPMIFKFGDEEYFEVPGEIDSHANYDRIRAGEVATTSQLNIDYLYNRFRSHVEQGNDVIYIAFSSGLSGTCANGIMAARMVREEFPDRRVEVVDSLQASQGEGILALELAKRVEQGEGDIDALVAYANELKMRINTWFTVDDLKYLKRGGRISATTAALGTMLSIKPVMNVDDEGHLIPVANERGRKRALRALVERMAQHQPDLSYPICISHGDCLDEAELLADMVEHRFGVRPQMIAFVGMVIGSHSGPGTMGLIFVGDNRG